MQRNFIRLLLINAPEQLMLVHHGRSIIMFVRDTNYLQVS